MTAPQKQKELKKTKDLHDLSSPEETAKILRRSYDKPLEELVRRKAVSEAEGHPKNILYWQTVETILSNEK